MKIEKFKYLGNSKYEIIINGETFIIYEDIILKYNLLSKKDITNEEIKKLNEENKYYVCYYEVLKYLKNKLRSEKEVRLYLNKKEVNKNTIAKIINQLKKEHLIDDFRYAQCYINDCINLTNNGPLKVIRFLEEKGISKTNINLNICTFTKDIQEEKIKKYINKQIALNKNKSSLMLKNKILNNLIYMGFNKEYVLLYLENVKINDSKLYEIEYKKLYDKLSKKYSGYELEQKIKQKLYIKGLKKED